MRPLTAGDLADKQAQTLKMQVNKNELTPWEERNISHLHKCPRENEGEKQER